MFHRQEEFGGEGKCFRLYSTGSAARASLWNLPRFLEGLGRLLQRRGLRAVGRPLLSVRFPMRAIRGLTPSLASVCQGRALTGRR